MSKALIPLFTERMSGYGAYPVETANGHWMEVNYLYGLDDLCKNHVTTEMSVLELGTNEGASTMVFAGYAKEVVTVDINRNPVAVKRFNESPKKNIEYLSPDTFANAAQWFYMKDRKFDLVYIDGNHDYKSFLSDLFYARDVVNRKTGVIAGHDLNDKTPDVKRVLDDLSKSIDYFSYSVYRDSSWVANVNADVIYHIGKLYMQTLGIK